MNGKDFLKGELSDMVFNTPLALNSDEPNDLMINSYCDKYCQRPTLQDFVRLCSNINILKPDIFKVAYYQCLNCHGLVRYYIDSFKGEII